MSTAIVYLPEEITAGSFQNFVKDIQKYRDYTEIIVYINCFGGLTGEAKSIRNFLLAERKKGVLVTTHAHAYCDSAAVIVFLAGTVRKIDKYSESFLVHRVRGGMSGTAEELYKAAEEIENTELGMAEIYSLSTGMNLDMALNLIKAEKSLTVQEVLNYGFATEITEPELALDLYNNRFSQPIKTRLKNIEEKEIKEVRQAYKSTVNMSYSELKAWAATECSKLAGLDREPIKRNLELLETPAESWTAKHASWANKTISFVSRMKKNLGGKSTVKDKSGKECGTKAKISLKNWAYDPDKKANNTSINNSMDFKKINQKKTPRTWAAAQLLGKSFAKHRAEIAQQQYLEYLASNNSKPENMSMALEDGTKIYVFSEDQSLIGKRVVLADEDMNPTDQPAPEGEHVLSDSRTITVKDGLIVDVKEAEEQPENMGTEEQPENMEAEEKKKAMEAEEKKKAMEYEKKKEESSNSSKDITALEKELEKKIMAKLESQYKIKPERSMADNTNEKPHGKVTEILKAPAGSKIHCENTKQYVQDIVKFEKAKQRVQHGNANDIVFTDNDYTGDAMIDYLAEILLGANDIELFTIVKGLKNEHRLSVIETETELQNPSAVWTPNTQDIDIDYSRTLNPVPYEVQQQIQLEKLITSYHAYTVDLGSLNDYKGSAAVRNFWLSRISERVKNLNSSLRWLGKAGTPQATFSAGYDGLIDKGFASAGVKKLTVPQGVLTVSDITVGTAQATATVNDSSSLEVGDYLTFTGIAGTGGLDAIVNNKSFQILDIPTATTVLLNLDTSAATPTPDFTAAQASFINVSNIIAAMSVFTNNIPEALRDLEEFKIHIPLHLKNVYYRAVASPATGAGDYFLKKRDLAFLDRSLVSVNYMPKNTIWGNHKGNQFYGVDLEADSSTLRVIDLSQYSQNEFLSAKMRMKTDVNFALPQECLLMGRPA